MINDNNILITADSTCDLPQEIVEKYGIKIIPLSILLGDNEYLDGVDVNPKDIYKYVSENGDLPKTAAVPPAKYMQIFEEAVNQGKSVVHIGLSSAISSSFANSQIASSELDNVYCIDSKSLCTAMGLLVLKACDLRADGLSANEIADKITALVPKVSTTFILNSLEFLHKGGRCSGIAKFGANVLGIKPSIAVDSDGKLDVAKKYRGKLEIAYTQYVCDRLVSSADADPSRIVIANSGEVDDQTIESIKQLVIRDSRFDEIILADAGCTISSHCGPKTLAIFYINN